MIAKAFNPEKLKDLLHEYGSLANAIEVLEKEKASLETEVQHLQGLKAEKADLMQKNSQLETEVQSLAEFKAKLDEDTQLRAKEMTGCETSVSHLKAEIKNWRREKSALQQEIEEREQRRNCLIKELKPLEKNIKFKEDLDREIGKATVRLESVETRLKAEARRLEVFDAFLALVQAGDWHELQLFSSILPDLLRESQEKSYSVETLRNHIVNYLAGNTSNVLSCGSCGAEFFVNGPPRYSSYQCPSCHMSIMVRTKVELADILRSLLHRPDAGEPPPGSKHDP